MSLFNDLPPPASTSSKSGNQAKFSSDKPTMHPAQGFTHIPAQSTNQPTTLSSYKEVKKRVGKNRTGRPDASRKRLSSDGVSSIFSKQSKLDDGFLAKLKSYVAERKGERDDMQDAHVLLNDCTQDFTQLAPKINRVAYYAVFDGHGGSRASTYASKWLHVHLSRKLPKGDVTNFDKELKRQILETFRKVDEDFLKEASQNKPVWKDGTTACCVLVLNDALYISNLGDSKAILCRYQSESKKHVSIPLSKEHNPTNYDERMRIQKAGGNVREGRVLGILEVSRSIGDGQYKRCGVINVPDVKRCQLNSNDRFFLIACDGLWKVFNPDDAIQFVLQVLQDNSVVPPEGSSKSLEEFRYEAACNKLASEAVRKGSADNVTVLLVSVQKL